MKNVGWKVNINCLIYAHKQTKTLSGGIFNSPVWLLSEEKGEEGRKSMEYVLELKNIYKSFPGVKVLEDVTLQVRPGEVHALMGENGAGKSTLMKILMGIYKADQGSIFLEGKETVIHGPKDAMSKGISMIHQELNTVLDMEVAENVFVGRELLKKGMEKLKIVDIARMREETRRYFRKMNIDIDPRAKMRTLSVAEMQLVEIVKAISLNSRIIVMDEPTSAITEKEATVLFAQIERLKKQGVAIIYISHKMDEIFRISDTITVLRDGQWIGTKPAKEAGVNVVIVNQRISDPEAADCYVGADAATTGSKLMEEVMKDIDGKGNVALLLGPMGSDGQVGRSEGFDQVLADYPDVTVAFQDTAEWQTEPALTIVENWLNAGKEISAVVAQNDSMAVGAAKAIADAQKTGEIKVYGIDATSEGLQAVLDGKLQGTMAQGTADQGKFAADAYADLLDGKEVDSETIVDNVYYTADNAQEALDAIAK